MHVVEESKEGWFCRAPGAQLGEGKKGGYQ